MTDPLDKTYRVRLHSEILEIASRIVADEGLGALQARRVAAKAGCSVGTLYNVFGDLDGLTLAVCETTLDLMSRPLRQAFETHFEKATGERLMALALTYMRFAFDNLLAWRAVFDYRLPPARELPADYGSKRAQLLWLIEETIKGEVRDKSQRTHAARALFAAVHGIIALALDNKLAPFDAAEVECEIRFIVAAAATGLQSVK